MPAVALDRYYSEVFFQIAIQEGLFRFERESLNDRFKSANVSENDKINLLANLTFSGGALSYPYYHSGFEIPIAGFVLDEQVLRPTQELITGTCCRSGWRRPELPMVM